MNHQIRPDKIGINSAIPHSEERTYREWIKHDDLTVVRVAEQETDLLISGDGDLTTHARTAITRYRGDIEAYISQHPRFQSSLSPMDVDDDAPDIIKDMAAATHSAGVGPMAAVAGAIAEFVGKELLKFSEQIVIENGGDIFLKTTRSRVIGVYAGDSPFTGKMALSIEADKTPLGVCTSSGTVGHSLSLGKADAVEPAVAREYGVETTCIFLGRQPNSELPLLYLLMDVLVLPSLFEGVPRVVMEASAMGVPAIVTDVKGNREAVEHGRNGLLVPFGDVQALAKAIVELVTDKKKALHMGKEGRRIVKERFDEQMVFQRVKDEYARLLIAKGIIKN